MRSLLVIGVILLMACQNEDYSPKPRGYHRIDFPTKTYKQVGDTGCPFTFQVPAYSELHQDQSRGAQPCWKNLDFPQFNARLHLSYLPINAQSPLSRLSEDARKFAFTHTTKATAIDQVHIAVPEHDIYGLVYNIRGNTASNYQFYVSDSSQHYLRGALYFNEKPNLDSIQPVLDFLSADIEHLVQTMRWR